MQLNFAILLGYGKNDEAIISGAETDYPTIEPKNANGFC